MEFVAGSLPMTRDGFAGTAGSLGVSAPEVWAVLSVETSACGFLPDRRPTILFERHVFSRLTGGRFNDGDISDPSPGGYGPLGAPQYTRLNRALLLDRLAALKSASWGLAQMMGENYSAAGFAGVNEMVAAISGSEDSQLSAFAAFLKSTGLDRALRAHDWTSFARGYNGAAYSKNQYDVRLRGEFQKYSVGALPDIEIRAAQICLMFRGFQPGLVDGVEGRLTTAALQDFQKSIGLTPTGVVDPDTMARLRPAPLP
jgi:peptidoglycan hydrolase-like protein with peptidoglycan-binding domain